jgi:hypothetical protein
LIAPPAVRAAVAPVAYRAELGRNLRYAGAAMLAASYAVPLAPDVGPLCPLRRLTGVPCPFCGLTTGVVSTSHGHVAAGLSANPLAPLLVVATLAGWLAWALTRTGRVRRPGWEPSAAAWPAARWALVPAIAGLWLFELARFGFL